MHVQGEVKSLSVLQGAEVEQGTQVDRQRNRGRTGLGLGHQKCLT